MDEKDIKVYMKVKFNSNDRLKNNAVYKTLIFKNQDYAYVNYLCFYTEPHLFILSDEIGGVGDYFISDDFEPYIKEERKLKLQIIHKRYKSKVKNEGSINM